MHAMKSPTETPNETGMLMQTGWLGQGNHMEDFEPTAELYAANLSQGSTWGALPD